MEQNQNEPGIVRPWLLIILAVVVIAGIGFFVWSQQQNKKTTTVASTPTTTTTPATSAVSTAGWKTYTNTDYSYSIKYPSTWTVNLESKNSTGKTDPVFLVSGENYMSQSKVVDIQVYPTTIISSARVDGADYIKRNGNVIISTSPVVVGGVSTDKFITNFNNGYGMIAYVEKNSETYILELNNTASSDKEYIDNFNTMLSTFQFTK